MFPNVFLSHICSIVLIVCVVVGFYYEVADHRRFLFLELCIDTFLLLDVTYRICSLRADFLKDVFNLLDVVSVIVVCVHWIVFIILPLFDEFDFAWVFVRYCVHLCRLYYFVHSNAIVLKTVYKNNATKYTKIEIVNDTCDENVFGENADAARFVLNSFNEKEWKEETWLKMSNVDVVLVVTKNKKEEYLFFFINGMTKCHVVEKHEKETKVYYDILIKKIQMDDNDNVALIKVNDVYCINIHDSKMCLEDREYGVLKLQILQHDA